MPSDVSRDCVSSPDRSVGDTEVAMMAMPVTWELGEHRKSHLLVSWKPLATLSHGFACIPDDGSLMSLN